MNIYLIRHGETEWNNKSLLQGRTDIPLNDYGRELAEITAEALKDIDFDMIFHSPLIRARETAEILKRDRAIPIRADERIIEIAFGVEEGAHIPTINETPQDPLYNFLKDPGSFIPPEQGESFEDVYKRSQEFLTEQILPLEGKCDNVLIVAHGALNRTILNSIAGIPISDFWKIRLKNCAVSMISLEKGEFQLVEESKIFYESKPVAPSILT